MTGPLEIGVRWERSDEGCGQLARRRPKATQLSGPSFDSMPDERLVAFTKASGSRLKLTGLTNTNSCRAQPFENTPRIYVEKSCEGDCLTRQLHGPETPLAAWMLTQRLSLPRSAMG
jgi:hypothetical protein